MCTASHDGILNGYAGGIHAPGSFGSFLASLPIGTEIMSMSGVIAIWTGNYTTHRGHAAAHLEPATEGGPAAIIYLCLVNVWNPTGKIVTADGATINVRHMRGTGMIVAHCTTHGEVGDWQAFRDASGRDAAYADARAHVADHD